MGKVLKDVFHERKTVGRSIKWIICFLQMLLKVFFDKMAILSNKNLIFLDA